MPSLVEVNAGITVLPADAFTARAWHRGTLADATGNHTRRAPYHPA
ncbi:hypothetical protein [Ochrobactrum quorumnocens]|nr:hypothetical protein [[Ochrobactrum] quorumnocens]